MRSFVYESRPSRVVFREGALADIPVELSRLGSRALVFCTPGQRDLADEILRDLGDNGVGIFDQAVMHVPVVTVRSALELATSLRADCYVAVGGGSTLGLAKALALETSLPILAIPTTYAGSEMTPIWGITEDAVKKTGRNSRVVPKTVIYDPSLTVTMPPSLSGTSGINAIAHCVEALYADNANPVISLIAEEGIRALARSLPRIIERPDDSEARNQALYGAWLAGLTLGSVNVALHHKLCHTVGGAFNLPHAEIHTVILPHAVAYNRDAAPAAMSRIAAAVGSEDAALGLYDLARRVGATLSLKSLGMPADGVERAVELAVTNPYPNPRPLSREGIRALLQDAYEGSQPRKY